MAAPITPFIKCLQQTHYTDTDISQWSHPRYVLSIIVYGLSLGSFLYTGKMFLYNSVKAKDFAHVWSMMMASQSMSALAGIMITGMITILLCVAPENCENMCPMSCVYCQCYCLPALNSVSDGTRSDSWVRQKTPSCYYFQVTSTRATAKQDTGSPSCPQFYQHVFWVS